MKKKLEKILGFTLEATGNPDFGDYTANIALTAFSGKQFQISNFQSIFNIPNSKFKNPRELAETLAEKLKQNHELLKLVDKVEVAGPGFINFWLKTDALVNNLIQISKEKEKYGKSAIFKGQKVMFEYAHPNTHKAFHIGHLRNITTGETLSRLYEAMGADVIRANYQGDVGLHIAKAIWGIRKLGFSDPKEVKARSEYLGKAYSIGSKAYETDEGAKEEIQLINANIYDKSDSEINELYQKTRKWSLDYFDGIYKRVYTRFDRLYFESEVFEDGKKIALEALKKGILKESDGAVIFPGSEYGLHDRVFISGKGVPTYEAKDLGLAKLQFAEYNPDKLIHTVGPEQTAYFQVIFKALELIEPETKGREIHIPYGWVRLKNGKMSSRTGNVILGEDILNQAKDSIIKDYKTDKKIAEQIAVAAVKYSFLKSGLTQDIAFDLKESISLEGNSGPYLQYTVARCNSVLAKANIKDGHIPGGIKKNAISDADHTFKGEPLKGEYSNLDITELNLLRGLVHFSEIVENSAQNYSPNLLCNYLYDLAQKYNSFYNAEKIIGSDNEEMRLMLTFGVAQVLKNGLRLLGIEAPEKM